METKTFYAVWSNTDLTEGRGNEYVKYFCEIEATANRLSKGGYVMGTDCHVNEITLFKPDNQYMWYGPVSITKPDTVDLKNQAILDSHREMLINKAAAISKAKSLGLTDDEINAIGFNERK